MATQLTPGATLRERRVELGHTQEQLAQILGVTAQYVYNLESGRRDPGKGLMLKLQDYGIPLEVWFRHVA